MPFHGEILSFTDLAIGYIKKATRREIDKVKDKLITVGQTAAATLVCSQLQAKLGIPHAKCQIVANIVVRKLTKAVRDTIKK